VNVIRGISTVFRFEWKRSLTRTRAVWWFLLAMFPPALLLLIVVNQGRPPGYAPAAIVTFVLCPCVVCMLGVFLWATPWISSELEGRSWVYLAVRPGGAWSVLFGKYLVAVTWTLPAGLLASALSVLVIARTDYFNMIWIQWRLVTLSCFAYGAVFTLIGVMFPKRAMVVGVFFTIVFEVVLAWVPAAVNLMTIQFRLRCLLARWLGLDKTMVPSGNPVLLAYFGDESAAWHFSVLMATTIGLLVAAAITVNRREFTAEAETDV
jgi:ABC-type transport system involved in multi-copper enzyme maturation permease subunit